MSSFLKTFSSVTNTLFVDIEMIDLIHLRNTGETKSITKIGVIDTGAHLSGISPSAAKTLGLVAISSRRIRGVNEEKLCSVYAVDTKIGNLSFHRILPAEMDFKGFDFLIGMDILSRCDMFVSNHSDQTQFELVSPTTGKYFSHPIQSRNSQCACGSGKKYKQCCGK